MLGTPVGAQTLSSAEREMRDWVQAHRQEEVDYLAKVVNINSGTFNLPGVKAVGDEFAE
jgi:glutamate carboxypeptidase